MGKDPEASKSTLSAGGGGKGIAMKTASVAQPKRALRAPPGTKRSASASMVPVMKAAVAKKRSTAGAAFRGNSTKVSLEKDTHGSTSSVEGSRASSKSSKFASSGSCPPSLPATKKPVQKRNEKEVKTKAKTSSSKTVKAATTTKALSKNGAASSSSPSKELAAVTTASKASSRKAASSKASSSKASSSKAVASPPSTAAWSSNAYLQNFLAGNEGQLHSEKAALASPSMAVEMTRSMLAWYGRNKRDLPWRRKPNDAYAILISEVMLQQTRVAAVIPYWQRWLSTWPTALALAREPSLDRVLEHWAGLGYYNRARNLKRVAETVCFGSVISPDLVPAPKNGCTEVSSKNGGATASTSKNGDTAGTSTGKVCKGHLDVDTIQNEHATTPIISTELPRTREFLQKLPGIGPYTASAIASIAYGEAVGVVDGNVARVLHRVFAVPGDIQLAPWLWSVMDKLVGAYELCAGSSAVNNDHLMDIEDVGTEVKKRKTGPSAQKKKKNLVPGLLNQGVMEIGALVCTPDNPDCAACPWSTFCRGKNEAATLGRKAKKKAVPSLEFDVALVARNAGTEIELAVVRETEGTLLRGQYRFPYLKEVEAAARNPGSAARPLTRLVKATADGKKKTQKKSAENKIPRAVFASVKHTFSSQVHTYHVSAYTSSSSSSTYLATSPLEWKSVGVDLSKALVSTGQNKIWAQAIASGFLDCL
ncbi:unnamed protein product [Amoebophrya sp. A25]|nr:unnamed protein product [Amoebophrya sp. A25]|eukprot:GSA25T00008860001.1